MFKDGQILYMTYRSCLWGVDEVDVEKPIREGMGWGLFYLSVRRFIPLPCL